jgi:hypothetical protein
MGGTPSIDIVYAISPEDIDQEIATVKRVAKYIKQVDKAETERTVAQLEAAREGRQAFSHLSLSITPSAFGPVVDPYTRSYKVFNALDAAAAYLKILKRIKEMQAVALGSWSNATLERKIQAYEPFAVQSADIFHSALWIWHPPASSWFPHISPIAPLTLRQAQKEFAAYVGQLPFVYLNVEFDAANIPGKQGYFTDHRKIRLNGGYAQLILRALWWVRNTRKAYARTSEMQTTQTLKPLQEARWLTKRAIAEHSRFGGGIGEHHEPSQLESIIHSFVTGEEEKKAKTPAKKTKGS